MTTYKTDLTESISIRITKEQKDMIDKLTTQSGGTLKEYILSSTIYSSHIEEVENLELQLLEVSKEVKDMEGVRYEVERLSAILESKDERIHDLNRQLQYANQLLKDNYKLMDQQQQLNLATLDSNKALKVEIEEVRGGGAVEGTNSNSRKGFFARLFS